MRLLYVFPTAAAIVVAAVWVLGAVNSWWVLVPAFVVYLLASGWVMRALFRALASEEQPEELPVPPRLLPH